MYEHLMYLYTSTIKTSFKQPFLFFFFSGEIFSTEFRFFHKFQRESSISIECVLQTRDAFELKNEWM